MAVSDRIKRRAQGNDGGYGDVNLRDVFKDSETILAEVFAYFASDGEGVSYSRVELKGFKDGAVTGETAVFQLEGEEASSDIPLFLAAIGITSFSEADMIPFLLPVYELGSLQPFVKYLKSYGKLVTDVVPVEELAGVPMPDGVEFADVVTDGSIIVSRRSLVKGKVYSYKGYKFRLGCRGVIGSKNAVSVFKPVFKNASAVSRSFHNSIAAKNKAVSSVTLPSFLFKDLTGFIRQNGSSLENGDIVIDDPTSLPAEPLMRMFSIPSGYSITVRECVLNADGSYIIFDMDIENPRINGASKTLGTIVVEGSLLFLRFYGYGMLYGGEGTSFIENTEDANTIQEALAVFVGIADSVGMEGTQAWSRRMISKKQRRVLSAQVKTDAITAAILAFEQELGRPVKETDKVSDAVYAALGLDKSVYSLSIKQPESGVIDDVEIKIFGDEFPNVSADFFFRDGGDFYYRMPIPADLKNGSVDDKGVKAVKEVSYISNIISVVLDRMGGTASSRKVSVKKGLTPLQAARQKRFGKSTAISRVSKNIPSLKDLRIFISRLPDGAVFNLQVVDGHIRPSGIERMDRALGDGAFESLRSSLQSLSGKVPASDVLRVLNKANKILTSPNEWYGGKSFVYKAFPSFYIDGSTGWLGCNYDMYDEGMSSLGAFTLAFEPEGFSLESFFSANSSINRGNISPLQAARQKRFGVARSAEDAGFWFIDFIGAVPFDETKILIEDLYGEDSDIALEQQISDTEVAFKRFLGDVFGRSFQNGFRGSSVELGSFLRKTGAYYNDGFYYIPWSPYSISEDFEGEVVFAVKDAHGHDVGDVLSVASNRISSNRKRVQSFYISRHGKGGSLMGRFEDAVKVTGDDSNRILFLGMQRELDDLAESYDSLMDRQVGVNDNAFNPRDAVIIKSLEESYTSIFDKGVSLIMDMHDKYRKEEANQRRRVSPLQAARQKRFSKAVSSHIFLSNVTAFSQVLKGLPPDSMFKLRTVALSVTPDEEGLRLKEEALAAIREFDGGLYDVSGVLRVVRKVKSVFGSISEVGKVEYMASADTAFNENDGRFTAQGDGVVAVSFVLDSPSIKSSTMGWCKIALAFEPEGFSLEGLISANSSINRGSISPLQAARQKRFSNATGSHFAKGSSGGHWSVFFDFTPERYFDEVADVVDRISEEFSYLGFSHNKKGLWVSGEGVDDFDKFLEWCNISDINPSRGAGIIAYATGVFSGPVLVEANIVGGNSRETSKYFSKAYPVGSRIVSPLRAVRQKRFGVARSSSRSPSVIFSVSLYRMDTFPLDLGFPVQNDGDGDSDYIHEVITNLRDFDDLMKSLTSLKDVPGFRGASVKEVSKLNNSFGAYIALTFNVDFPGEGEGGRGSAGIRVDINAAFYEKYGEDVKDIIYKFFPDIDDSYSDLKNIDFIKFYDDNDNFNEAYDEWKSSEKRSVATQSGGTRSSIHSLSEGYGVNYVSVSPSNSAKCKEGMEAFSEDVDVYGLDADSKECREKVVEFVQKKNLPKEAVSFIINGVKEAQNRFLGI